MISTVNAQTYSYTLIPQYSDGDEFPSNTVVSFKAIIEPSTSTEVITVTFSTQWGYVESRGASGGEIEFKVKTPESGQYWTKFESPYFETVIVTINIVKAIKCYLEYEPIQYYAPSYDPDPNRDIVIFAQIVDTDTNSSITIDKLTITCDKPIVNTMYNKLENGYDIIVTTYDIIDSYKITVIPEKYGYLSINSTALIQVRKPILYVKAVIGNVEAIIGKDQSIEVDRNTQNIILSLYNSKMIPLTDINAKITHILLRGGSRETVYERYNPTRNEKNEYIVPITLSDAYYELIVEAEFGTEYVTFNEMITIRTYKSGFDIFQFIMSPFILLGIIVVIAIIIYLLKRREHKINIRGGVVW